MSRAKRVVTVALAAVVVLGAVAILTPPGVFAAGRGGPCPCPKTIQTPCGTCKLVSCGTDCVYVCPLVPCSP